MPAIPNKLFDVRNGNGVTDTDSTVYNRAELIVFKDNAAKNAMLDAFAAVRGYQATIPDPQNQGQTIPNPKGTLVFFRQELTAILKEIYKAYKVQAAIKAAQDSANASVTDELQ